MLLNANLFTPSTQCMNWFDAHLQPQPIHQAAIPGIKENSKLNRMRIIVWLRFGGNQSHNNNSNRLYRLIRGVAAAAGEKIAIHFGFLAASDQPTNSHSWINIGRALIISAAAVDASAPLPLLLALMPSTVCTYRSYHFPLSFIFGTFISLSFMFVQTYLDDVHLPDCPGPAAQRWPGPNFPSSDLDFGSSLIARKNGPSDRGVEINRWPFRLKLACWF